MKNGKKRILSLLLALTLVTTCLIGNTFAKYVTSNNSGSQTATVAKWGVKVSSNASGLFSTYYLGDDTNYQLVTTDSANTATSVSQNISVKAESTNNIIAPGTQSGKDGLKLTVSGEPEVAVRIKLEIVGTPSDIFLKDPSSDLTPTFPDYTDESTSGGFNFTSLDIDEYNPVKFTLSCNGTALNGCKEVTLADIKSALENYSSEIIEPGTNLSKEEYVYNLTWKWDYYNDQKYEDAADTLLGELASGNNTAVDAKNYNLTTSFNIKLTVEQVD